MNEDNSRTYQNSLLIGTLPSMMRIHSYMIAILKLQKIRSYM